MTDTKTPRRTHLVLTLGSCCGIRIHTFLSLVVSFTIFLIVTFVTPTINSTTDVDYANLGLEDIEEKYQGCSKVTSPGFMEVPRRRTSGRLGVPVQCSARPSLPWDRAAEPGR